MFRYYLSALSALAKGLDLYEVTDVSKFPYALKALPKVLADKWDDPEFQQYKDAFPESARSSPEELEAHVKDLTDKDVKIASLKNLQGDSFRIHRGRDRY